MIRVEQLAGICHEANRRYCVALGDSSQPPWDEAPDWLRASAIEGARFLLECPTASPQSSHENWLAHKHAAGWKLGSTKDAVKKEHPCMVPFEELTLEQAAKDHLFHAIVRAMTPHVATGAGRFI